MTLKIRFAAVALALNCLLPSLILMLGLSFSANVGEVDLSQAKMMVRTFFLLCLIPAAFAIPIWLKKSWSRWPGMALLLFFASFNLVMFTLMVRTIGPLMLSPAFRTSAFVTYFSLAVPFVPSIAGYIGIWFLFRAKI